MKSVTESMYETLRAMKEAGEREKRKEYAVRFNRFELEIMLDCLEERMACDMTAFDPD